MKVTAVIPSLYHVDGDYLKVCVESLRETTDWDIIVVTNGTNNKPDLSDIKGITTHIHTPAQGQCQAVNAGANVMAPDTDYLFVSNSDMYYAPNWNKNLRFDDLCFSPNLIEPVDNAGSAPPFLKRDWGVDLEAFKKDRADTGVISALTDMQFKPGSFDDKSAREEEGFNFPFFIDANVWRTIGGYDIVYDPWGSNGDTDLQMKIELAGIKPKRYRDILVYHFSNKSGTFDGSHQDFWQHNWDYLTEKWGFNRDDLKSDTWYCKDMLDYDKLKYKPEWKGRYGTR